MKTVCCCLLIIVYFNGYSQPNKFVFREQKMGSPFTILLYTEDSISAATTAVIAFKLVDSLVEIFSDYIDSSELNRLCVNASPGHPPFIASPALFDILSKSAYAWKLSEGAFDISLGPLTRLWRKARKDQVWPHPDTVAAKKALTGFDKISLNPLTHEVKLASSGMQLDLGGIAQGYIAEKVIRRIEAQGIRQALVDVSGDIIAIGAPPGKPGWSVGINLPEESNRLLPRHLLIKNKAVTTSGDVYQYFIHDGKKYSHIIDPLTGYGITTRKNVTVIADDGTTADWFTKACSLLPIRKAKKLARRLNAAFLISTVKNNKLVTHQTNNFGSYFDNTQKANRD